MELPGTHGRKGQAASGNLGPRISVRCVARTGDLPCVVAHHEARVVHEAVAVGAVAARRAAGPTAARAATLCGWRVRARACQERGGEVHGVDGQDETAVASLCTHGPHGGAHARRARSRWAESQCQRVSVRGVSVRACRRAGQCAGALSALSLCSLSRCKPVTASAMALSLCSVSCRKPVTASPR